MKRASLVLFAVVVASCKRSEPSKPKSLVVTPEMAASAAGYEPPVVSVVVGASGVRVSVRGQNVAPGCGGMGQGFAVSSADGGVPDPGDLQRCLEKLKLSVPGLVTKHSAVLTAESGTSYATALAWMDAIRTTSDGRELFPDIVFGVPEGDR